MDLYNFGLQSYTIILLILTPSLTAGSNIDCNGKAFHCVNTTHFKICVDLGRGLSKTVDEYLIPCPRNTVCKQYNLFECEYVLTTNEPPLTIQSEVTNEQFQTSDNVWKQLDVTTLYPIKQPQGMELSEKYYNALPESFTTSFLSDAVNNSISSTNTNDLLTELTFPATESRMSVTQTSPYNNNTSATDIGVSSNYNTEITVSHLTMRDRRPQTNLLKSESLEPLNQNSLDLDEKLLVSKTTNEVNNVSELRSDAVTLLPDFRNRSLQDTPSTNINRLIKFDNTSQDRNLDILIKHNTTQLNNTQYHNKTSMYSINTNTLNLTTPNVLIDEIFNNDISKINEKSTVKSGITSEQSRRYLVEATTTSTSFELSSTISSNTTDAIETFSNVGLNKNVEEISLTDSYITISTAIIPEITTVKPKAISIQITNSMLNYSVSTVAITNPISEEKNVALRDKTATLQTNSSKITDADEIFNLDYIEVNLTTQLNNVNILQYLSSTEAYLDHRRNDISAISTSISETLSPKNISEVLNFNSKEATQVNSVSQIDNENITKNVSINTDAPNETHPNLDYLNELISTKIAKNHSNPSSSLLFNNSLFTTPATKTAISDKIIVENYTSTSINMLPVLTTVNMTNEPQGPSFNQFNEIMSKENPKEYSITTSALPLNTYPFTTVASESAITDRIVDDGFSSASVDMFPISRKGDVTSETQAYLTVLDESVNEKPDNYSTPSTLNVLVSTKYPKNKSNVNYSLFINNSTIPQNDISPKYNTTPNVMIYNNKSTIVDTLSTSITKTISSSNQSTALKGRATNEYKLIVKESYEMKQNNNKTWPAPDMVAVATYLADSNIVINTEIKPISDLVLKNETLSKPVMVVVATQPENKNLTKTSNNITEAMSNGLTSLKSTSESISTTSKIQPEVLKLLTVTDSVHKEIIGTTSTILTERQSFNESTTSLSSSTIIPDYVFRTEQVDTLDSARLITSTESIIGDLERDTTSITTSLPATVHNATILNDRSSMAVENNNTNHNDGTTKSVINSLYRVNQVVSPISTFVNNISDIYETGTGNVIASTMVKPLMDTIEFINSTDLRNNTIDVINVLSEYRHDSDNNKSREIRFKLESMMTTNPSSDYNSNISNSKHVISSETRTLSTPSSQSDRQKLNKQLNYENSYENGTILSKNIIDNLKSTESNGNVQKLVTNDNFILLTDLNKTNKINNSLGDIKEKHNQVTSNLVVNSLTVEIININNTVNYTDKNVTSPVSSNSKSTPLIYLHSSLTNSSLTDIYNVSQSNFSANINTTKTFRETTMPYQYHETEYKKSSQNDNNEPTPARFISNIKHEGNRTEYLLVNPYKQVTVSAKKVNNTIFKELSYNFSAPLLTVRKNLSHEVVMENITLTSADENTAPIFFYDIKGSRFNKTYIKTNNKSVNMKTNQLSENSASQHSGNATKPLLIVREPLEELNNTSLHTDNDSLGLITEYGLKDYFSDRINKSYSNLNRSELIGPVKNMTNYDNFYKGVINNRGIIPPLEANATKTSKTFIYGRNASNIKSILRTKDNYTNETSTTANKWLKNTISPTNSTQNNTQHATSTTALHFSKIVPSKFDRLSQSTMSLHTLKMDTTHLVPNITKLELIHKQDVITISKHTNRSNGTEKEEPRNSGYNKSHFPNETLQTQKSFTPSTDINYSDAKYKNMRTNQEFLCTKRGKYSDTNHCNKFFICIGRVQPIIGICPTDTVFSEFLKQCTRNVTHCIRNKQFKCTAAGRFINILSNNTYFICARNKSGFIRFTLQCQKGYQLNKNNIKCTPELINISKSDENRSRSTKELSVETYEKIEEVSVNSQSYFECEKEGKFNDPMDCRKYYVCKKGRKSVFRRKIRKCDSDEVFHRKKKKCVDEESYECDT